jgi:hypothetical protein
MIKMPVSQNDIARRQTVFFDKAVDGFRLGARIDNGGVAFIAGTI